MTCPLPVLEDPICQNLLMLLYFLSATEIHSVLTITSLYSAMWLHWTSVEIWFNRSQCFLIEWWHSYGSTYTSMQIIYVQTNNVDRFFMVKQSRLDSVYLIVLRWLPLAWNDEHKYAFSYQYISKLHNESCKSMPAELFHRTAHPQVNIAV